MVRYSHIRSKFLPKLTNNAKKYQIVTCFLAQKGDRLNIARLANQLKKLGKNKLVKEAFDELFRCSPIIDRSVWGNSCPKEVSALGNGDNCYYFKPDSLERELNWSILGLRRFSKQIREFVILRDQVERHILLASQGIGKVRSETVKGLLSMQGLIMKLISELYTVHLIELRQSSSEKIIG